MTDGDLEMYKKIDSAQDEIVKDSEKSRGLMVGLLQRSMIEDPDGSGALTVRQLSKSMGLSDRTIRNRLGDLIDDGTIECVQVNRKTISGVYIRVPGYRIIETGL